MPAPYSNENFVFNHIGISVPNCDDAVEWYSSIFGFHRVGSQHLADRDVNPNAPMFKMFGSKLRKAKIALLSSGNGVGIELFEFVDPPYSGNRNGEGEQGFEEGAYARGGCFHIAITAANVETVAAKVVENGGKRIGPTMGMFGENCLYVQDPWGNVIEVLSCSFERLMGKLG